ncbi:MAG: hypothetical protein K6A38_07310 [Lachnospiraceae bacterium]|nr:hypothetical protein [Lachnospiraceae bacterium]
MEETKRKNTNIIYNIILVCSGMLIPALSAYLYGKNASEIAGIVIIFTVMIIGVIFCYERQKLCGKLLFDNDDNAWRFYLTYIIGINLSVVFSLIADNGRPFLVVFVILTMVSDEITALVGGTSLLLLCELVGKGSGNGYLISYLVPAVISILLFSVIDEEFKIVIPMAISLLSQFVCLCVTGVLFANKTFELDLFLIPAGNVLICAILILIFLKIFSFSFVYKKDDRYMDILDPEFELLANLKNHSKEEYDHSIYTAVLCSKLAIKMGLDEQLTKAMGFYHRIGLLRGENSWENTEGLLREYDIPEEITDHLKEYFERDNGVRSRECAVLVIAETVISSVGYLFAKDRDIQINYEKLIDTIFQKKMSSFSDSLLSFNDINIMKKTLCEEKLFYDFLR